MSFCELPGAITVLLSCRIPTIYFGYLPIPDMLQAAITMLSYIAATDVIIVTVTDIVTDIIL